MALNNIAFYLRTSTKEYSTLRAKVAINGVYFFYSTGVAVNKNDWLNGQKIPKTDKLKLATIEAAISNTLLFYERMFKTPTNEQFKEKVQEFLAGSNAIEIAKRNDSIILFAEKFIKKQKPFKSRFTINAYNLSLKKLKEFGGANLSFDDITLSFYKKLTEKMQKQGYSRNYIGSIVKNICVFMKEAQKVEKLHNNEDYLLFRVESETADSIYLSMEELERIHKLVITPDLVRDNWEVTSDGNIRTKMSGLNKICVTMTKVKNRFLIGALCALRISDYNRLSVENIKDGVVSIMPLKGSNLRKPEPVKIPVHPMMREILESGFDLEEKIPEPVLNRQIKIICKMAGITETVTHYRTMGGKLVEMKSPKYKLVSSHTARRSGATNMYLANIPYGLIRVCTGHKTTEMLLKYIKVAYKEDNVQELKEYSYFGGSNESEKIIAHVKKALQSNEEPLWLRMIKEEIG